MIRKAIALGLLLITITVSVSVYMQIQYMQVLQRHFTPRYIKVTPSEMSRLFTKEQLAENAVTYMKGHQEISDWWAETVRLSRATMTSLVALALVQALLMLAMVIPSERQLNWMAEIGGKGIKVRAVVAGLLTGVVGGLTIDVILGIVVMLQSRYTSTHLEALEATALFKVAVLTKKAFFATLGGYVASRLSLPKGFINALVFGLVIFVIGFISALLDPQTTLLSKGSLALVGPLVFAIIGGYIATRHSLASKRTTCSELSNADSRPGH